MPNTSYEYTKEEVEQASQWFNKSTYPSTAQTPQQQIKFRKKMSKLKFEGKHLFIRVTVDENGGVRARTIPSNEIEPPSDVRYLQIIPSEEREIYMDEFMRSPHTCSYSARLLHDKVIRAGYLGVTRKYLEQYLKHPRFAKYLSGKKSTTTWIKSYRPSNPFELWQIDHTDITTKAEIVAPERLLKGTRKEATVKADPQKFKALFVIVDAFSKFVYLFPVQDKGNYKVAAILTKLFLDGDIPRTIQGDQAFYNEPLLSLCKQFGIHLISGKSNRPQQQGLVERVNRTIKDHLQKTLTRNASDKWVGMIPYIQLGLNTTKHDSTKYSPMMLHRGYDPISTISRNSANLDNPFYKEAKTKDEVEFGTSLIKLAGDTVYDPFEMDNNDPDDVADYDNRIRVQTNVIEKAKTNINAAADRREKRMRQKQLGHLEENTWVMLATYLLKDTSSGGSKCLGYPVILGLVELKESLTENLSTLVGRLTENRLIENHQKSLSKYHETLHFISKEYESDVVRQVNPFVVGSGKKTDRPVPLSACSKSFKTPYQWHHLGGPPSKHLSPEELKEWEEANNDTFKIISVLRNKNQNQRSSTKKYQLMYTSYHIDSKTKVQSYKKWLACIQINIKTELVWATYIDREYLKALEGYMGGKWQQPNHPKYNEKFFDKEPYIAAHKMEREINSRYLNENDQ
jgi:hypothetical protein